MIFRLFFSIIFLLLFNDLFGVTASPVPVTYLQPDGSELTLQLKGDERIHWAETLDGYTILSGITGGYVYAVLDTRNDLVLSAMLAHDPENRTPAELAFLSSIRPGIFFSVSQVTSMQSLLNGSGTRNPLIGGFPTSGTRKMLMILANFSNTTTLQTQSGFQSYMNQVNYNGTGSFRDYYLEVSYGVLTVNTTVTIWVTVPNTHDYYGPEPKWGEFIHDAVLAADNQAGINYAEYDNNGDTYVDGVAVIHQGRGQEESGNINDIWSHSWELTGWGFPTILDGVHVDAYTTIPELANAAGGMNTIGVMCHEFGHNLGAPDFYDTDYSTGGSYNGTGNWDLMASGSWNGVTQAGDKPPHPNAWVKQFFGWTNPVVITNGTHILRYTQTNTDAYRFNTTTSNEYFLCENRQKIGFDAALPGHGMIIYHVDGDYITAHMDANDINTTSHQGMFPMAANSNTANGVMVSTNSTINSSGCPWPGLLAKTTFTDATTPYSKSWAGANTGMPLTNITENGSTKTIQFCITSCMTAQDPQTFTATAAGSSQINLVWTKNSGSDPVMLAVSTTPFFGIPVNGNVYTTGSNISGGGTVLYTGNNTTFNHTGLSPNTVYYYKAWSVLTGNIYSPGLPAMAITTCVVSILPLVEGFEGGAFTPGCWREESSFPEWQYGNGGINGNPGSAHSGIRNAILFDQTTTSNRNKLVSPVLDLSPFSPNSVILTFWHAQIKWSGDQDQLRVYYRNSNGGPWQQLSEYLVAVNSWTQRTITLPALSSWYQVAFEGDALAGYGVCIDDIAIHAAGNWIGGTPGNPTAWNVGTNWDDGVVPNSLVNVFIPLRTHLPVVSTTASCNDITIESSAGITVNTGYQLQVNGNFIRK